MSDMHKHIEKIELLEKPDNKLVTECIVRMSPEKADALLADLATYEMCRRLAEQSKKGFSGWNTAQCTNFNLRERLLKNVESEDWVDVMNLAAMLLARSRMFSEVPLNEEVVT